MSRSLVFLREAEQADVATLTRLWSDLLRRVDLADRAADLSHLVEDARQDPDQRFLVAEYDGSLAGSVHLRVSQVTPFDRTLQVQAVSPHVFPEFRRHGVGHALVEAAVAWAEERGADYVSTAVLAGARDANRFMARLGLGPVATLRYAPTSVVRSRLAAARPQVARPGRQLTHVLAVRRSLRRQEAQTS